MIRLVYRLCRRQLEPRLHTSTCCANGRVAGGPTFLWLRQDVFLRGSTPKIESVMMTRRYVNRASGRGQIWNWACVETLWCEIHMKRNLLACNPLSSSHGLHPTFHHVSMAYAVLYRLFRVSGRVFLVSHQNGYYR